MARKKSVEIELDLQDRDAKRALKDIAKEAGKTEESLDDIESAGKKMARAIEQSADNMIDEIDATKRAVEAMERVLGDLDADPREVVADLKAVGLTAEDIEADADQLATALRRAGDVKMHATKQGFDDVGQAVGSVREGTDRAKDTMHGFVGGAVGELPLIGEAMGPVSEGLGQLVEGALAGEIGLRDMAKVVGPMAGVTAGVMLLQKALASTAETKAFNEEQVSEWRDIIEDLAPGLSAVNEQLREAQEISGRAGGIGTFFETQQDITDLLIDSGVKYDEWVAAVERGGPALDTVTGKLAAQRDALDAERLAVASSDGEHAEYLYRMTALDHAIEIAGETRRNYTETVEDSSRWEQWAAESTLESAEAHEEAEAAAEEHTDALEDQADALEESIDLITAQVDAQRAAVDAAYALTAAEFAYADTVTETAEAMKAGTEDTREHVEAAIELAEAAQAVADAKVRESEETAAASGATLSATQRIDIQNRSLLAQAANLNGPQRAAVINHIARLTAIPDSVRSDIKAAIARGDLAEAERLLNDASRTRTSTVRADADRRSLDAVRRSLDNLTQTRYVNIGARTGRGVAGVYATARGTRYSPGGPTLLGEEGPEVVDLPQGAAVTDAQASKGRMNRLGSSPAGAGPSGAPVYVTQIFPAGIRPADVIEAQRRYRRVQGPT